MRYFEPSAMDSYFEKQDKPTVFLVLGKEIVVDDEQLAMALSRLPKLRREVLLLYYFIGYRDEAIGRLYGRCRSSINRKRNVALKQLRKNGRNWNMRNKKPIPFEVTKKLLQESQKQYCQDHPALFWRPGVGRAHEKPPCCQCLVSVQKQDFLQPRKLYLTVTRTYKLYLQCFYTLI